MAAMRFAPSSNCVDRGHQLHLITRKNRRNDPDRLPSRKYDPVIRRHVDFREER